MPSSIDHATEDHDAVVATAQHLCGDTVIGAELCVSGGNNRVYRIRTENASFAAKYYGAIDADGRDRLSHEFDGLRFLQTSGIHPPVPKAIAVDRSARCAIYEWIDGRVPETHDAGDVAAVVTLLKNLHAARASADAAALPAATESVLRLDELCAQIDRRFDRLEPIAANDPGLRNFLTGQLRPEFERRAGTLRGTLTNAELAPDKRTLSPSDFGFHNALRRPDRSLVFIDFEYFGWDDPVKATADFLLHPAMILSANEKQAFLDGAFALYGGDPNFLPRLAASYPLYGIRWALIILNEFVPELWGRRTFSGKGEDWVGAKREQLGKAQIKLEAIRAYNEGQFIS
jgi:hypothetical protein